MLLPSNLINLAFTQPAVASSSTAYTAPSTPFEYDIRDEIHHFLPEDAKYRRSSQVDSMDFECYHSRLE